MWIIKRFYSIFSSGHSEDEDGDIAAEQMILYNYDLHHMFYFKSGKEVYRRVEMDREGLIMPDFYSSSTNSHSPVFPVCINCFGVLRYFMRHRKACRRGSIAFPVSNLESLYRGLCNQLAREREVGGIDRKKQMNWPHRSFTDGVPLTDTSLTQRPEYWVIITSGFAPQ